MFSAQRHASAHTKTQRLSLKTSVPRIPQAASVSEPRTPRTVTEARAELSRTCLPSYDSKENLALAGADAFSWRPQLPNILPRQLASCFLMNHSSLTGTSVLCKLRSALP